MNNQEIYNKINELAQKLGKDNSTITRSDLAWELKSLGVDGDSPEISKFVWECFQKSGNNDVRNVFVNNDKTSSLVDEYQIPAMVDEGSTDSVFDILSKKLKESGGILSNLDSLVTEKQKIEIMEKTSQIINTISGTNAVNKIQNDAQLVFQKYSQLTSSYSEAKTSIKNITKDFCELRQSTANLYRKYALQLQDIFGESIKASMPEMFNFESIEFLDVEQMLKNVELSYNSIYGKCGELASSISDSFATTLKLSASQFGKQQDKRVGLAIAGINMVAHYIKSTQQTSALRNEVQELKTSISHDVATIRTDEVRLLEVYKTLNDVYIPKAEIFAKSAPTVFDDELTQLIDSIYSTPEARQLKAQRDAILDELHNLERRITDEQMSISYYSGHITDSKQTLQSLEDEYKKAKDCKPEEPSGLSKVFSLGTSKKQYERDIFDWSKNCEPLVNKYEDLIVDVKIDGDELEAQQKAFAEDKKRYDELKIQQVDISNKLEKILSADPQLKVKVVAHLDDIIKLLHIAKDISSSKLDERLTKTAQVAKFQDVRLPENISKAVKDFKDSVTSSAKFTEQDAKDLTSDKLSEEEIQKITAQGNDILQTGIGLCNQMAQLEAMKMNYALSQEHYDKEFNKIKAAFNENIKQLDNQSAALQEIARRINTADNNADLKKGLLELLDKDYNTFSQQDWEDFMSGNKVIEL